MLTLCCECDKVIIPGDDKLPSHGICEECCVIWLRRSDMDEKDIEEFMDIIKKGEADNAAEKNNNTEN